MPLVEPLTRPPRRAGMATVRFDPGKTRADFLATRQGNDLRVWRDFSQVQVFSLQGGEQLLVRADPREIDRMRSDEDVVFMGTDEATFATAIGDFHLTNLLTGGEDAFYNGLKPTLIHDLEATLGTEAIGRQGDIWWATIATSRPAAERHRPAGMRPLCWQKTTNLRVFGTRHQLQGCHTGPGVKVQIDKDVITLRRIGLVTGRLSAPDHATRQLEGPSIIARTPGLLPSRGYVQPTDGAIIGYLGD